MPDPISQLTAHTTTPLDCLKQARETINPALRMAWEIKRRELAGPLDVLDLLPLTAEIDEAIKQGDALVQETEAVMRRLLAAPGTASPQVPTGF
jgi:hypothetical protein